MPKWIPVSEKLPNTGGYYWVTYYDNEVGVCWWSALYKTWYGRIVIAWMPYSKPAPYIPSGRTQIGGTR